LSDLTVSSGSELYTQTSINPPRLCIARAPEWDAVFVDAAVEEGDVVADATAVVFELDALVGVRGMLASILAIRCFTELISPEICRISALPLGVVADTQVTQSFRSNWSRWISPWSAAVDPETAVTMTARRANHW
jgi:hypothetical protein